MNRIQLLMLTAALCLSAAGCEMKNMEYSSAPQEETTTAETTTVTAEKTTTADTVSASTTTTTTTTTAEATTTTTVTTAPAEEDPDAIGQTLYDEACSRIFGMFCSTYYSTGNEAILDHTEWMEFYPVTDSRVKTVEDVKTDFCTVFSEEYAAPYLAEIDQKFRMIDGVLYCALGERGSDITYLDTELQLLSADQDTICFSAVSHYMDMDNGTPLPDQPADFILIRTANGWRVSAFTLPY